MRENNDRNSTGKSSKMTPTALRSGRPRSGFGERLRSLRLRRGLAQKDLAGPGVSTSYVSRLESGERVPSPQVVRHLATVLGVEPAELVGEASDTHQQYAQLWCEAFLALSNGERERAVDLLGRLVEVAEDPFLGWLARWSRVVLLSRGAEPERLLAAAEEMLDTWSPGGGVDAQVEVMRAMALRRLGRSVEAVQAAHEAMDRAPEPHDPLSALTYLRVLSTVCSELARAGRIAEAGELLGPLDELLRTVAPGWTAVAGWWIKAQIEDRLERKDEAIRSMTVAQRMVEELDIEPYFRHRVAIAAVSIALRSGRVDTEELTRQLDRIAHSAAPDSEPAAQGMMLRGELALHNGDPRAAWEWVERALEVGVLDEEDELRCRLALVQAAAELDDLPRLERARAELADLMERLNSPSIDPLLWRNVAKLALRTAPTRGWLSHG